MKIRDIVLISIVILGIFCSPALAISKADLISQYKAGQFWEPATPDPTPMISNFRPNNNGSHPILTRTPTPTPTPTPQVPASIIPSPTGFLPYSNDAIQQILEKWKAAQTIPSSWFIDPLAEYIRDVPSKGKPNIYLYNDRDLTAQVRLAPENAITVSDPVYQPWKGWRAEIRNGSLNGNGDFLFYEALGSEFPWQKEEGYVIRSAYREQDMALMLGQYGFNEKETREFIEYWSSHLVEDVDFVFYPQETAAVNQDMPLSVSPKPDHVMRIWFYAEPLVSTPEPVTSPERIIREGFYVVEWGVIIDDEYWINHSPASSEVVL